MNRKLKEDIKELQDTVSYLYRDREHVSKTEKIKKAAAALFASTGRVVVVKCSSSTIQGNTFASQGGTFTKLVNDDGMKDWQVEFSIDFN